MKASTSGVDKSRLSLEKYQFGLVSFRSNETGALLKTNERRQTFIV